MKLGNSQVRCAAVLSIGIVLLVAGTWTPANEEEVTISGYIEIAQYDDDGNVASVSIYDGEWGSVLISKQGKGAELLNHVDAEVELTGKIVELDDDSGFTFGITVFSYKIEGLEEPTDDRNQDLGGGELP